MQLTMKTAKFQEMVAKAVKGAGDNKMIPITSLMAIQLINNTLTLITTDASNYLKIIEKKVEGADFYVVVPAGLFGKLIAKTTVDSITLTLKENSLEVKGNGTYKIELPVDETGGLIKFPEYKFKGADAGVNVKLPVLKSIVSANKAAAATTMEAPYLTGYYFGDKVITTDSFKVAANNVKLFENPMLLPPEFVDLMAVLDNEDITVQRDGNKVLFTTENAIIYGVELEGIESYPYEAIKGYLETVFESMCKLPRLVLLSVLDRLNLFVSPFDKNSISMTFTPDGLIINSRKSDGSELIKYQDSKEFKPFRCSIDIEMLKDQVSVQEGDAVELYYGHESAIKMVSGKLTQITSLLEDEEAS